MTSTEIAVRKSNKDVARSMLIVGGALLVVGIILTFTSNWIADWINSGSGGIRQFVLHVWSVAQLLTYPLGSFLAVGSIIVNRLPEQPHE